MEERRLEGLVALITGSGGGEKGGIGAGVARCLAREGARIAVNDLRPEYADDTVRELKSMGVDAQAITGNVAKAREANMVVEYTASHFGRLDILVNNAGIAGHKTAVERTSDEDWTNVIEVNLNGPFFTSRAAVRLMRPKGFGRIINISSVAAIRVSYLGGAAYTAAKSGLLGFTRHLAAEVSQHGITVNAVLPGLVETPLIQANAPRGKLGVFSDGVPAMRMGKPEDIGAAVAFLATTGASYVTGAAIAVDGAMTVLPGDFSSYRINSGKDTG